MAPRLKTFLRAAAGFLLAGLFLFLAFQGSSVEELWNSLLRVNVFWVLALIPLTILGFWVRAVRWEYLLAPIKPNLSKRNLFSAVLIGYMINNILPRAGEFVRPYVIGKLENISKSSAFGTVVVERILDFMTFYFLVLVVMFFYPGVLDPFINYFNLPRPILVLVAVGLFLLFIVLFLKGESIFKVLSAVTKITPERYHTKIDRLRDSFLSGFGVSKMKHHFFALFALSVLLQATYAMTLYIPFYAFDSIRQLNLNFGASVVLLTISSIAYVLPVPGAMGTYHFMLSRALTNLYGVDLITAQSYSLVTHEVGYIVTMVVGLGYFLKDHVRVSDVTLETANGEAA